MRRRLTATVQLYSVDNLFVQMATNKRRAYIACYLHERLKALHDLAVEAFDEVVTGMYRRSESERDKDICKRGPAINEKLQMFDTIGSVLVDQSIPDAAVRRTIFEEIPEEDLCDALTENKTLIRPKDFNCFDYLERRYNYLRSFFPHFLSVVRLEGSTKAKPILEAVAALQHWNAERIRKVPPDAPLEFVPAKWRCYVCPDEEEIDRHYYELCALNELHAELQSGEIWVVGGRRYGNVEDLLIPRNEWLKIRDDCYKELGVPTDPTAWLKEGLDTLARQIKKTIKNFPNNPQVFIEDGKVHLKKLDAIELSEPVKLKERIENSWPQIRIQDLLAKLRLPLRSQLFKRLLPGKSQEAIK